METDFTNEVLEKLLLKRCLTNKKYLGIVSKYFDKRWFDNESIAHILNLTVSYYRKYDSIPDNRVLQALIKKYVEKNSSKNPDLDATKLINELGSIGTYSLNIPEETLKDNLDKFCDLKAFYWSMSDNVKDMGNMQDIEKCLDRFNSLRKMRFEDNDLGMNYFNPEDQKKHWEYITNPEAKIKTLWDGMDAYTNGGFLKDGKDLVCFCGQAGLGKSLFLSNIAVNFLKQNLSVVVISLEMSQDVYGKRFDAHISGNNINTLKETKETSLDRINRFYKEYPESNLYIKEYPPRTVKVSDIETYLENLKSNGVKIDVIIIDYLNLVLSNSKSDNMYESVLDVAEKLRAISYKFCAPVVTATQANSEGMNNENIGMQHISESRGIAHTVDELFMLFQMDEDRERGEINLRIAKNRAGGQVGKVIKFKMDPENLRLEDTSFMSGSSSQEDTSASDEIINNLDAISSDISNM